MINCYLGHAASRAALAAAAAVPIIIRDGNCSAQINTRILTRMIRPAELLTDDVSSRDRMMTGLAGCSPG